jgi:hypothetical protein
VAGEPDPAVGPRLAQLRFEALAPVALADDDRLEERLTLLHPDEHLDQLLEPLDRNEPAGGDHERRRRLRAAGREPRVDPGWHDRDALGLEPQLVHELALRRLRERDDGCSPVEVRCDLRFERAPHRGQTRWQRHLPHLGVHVVEPHDPRSLPPHG